MRHPYLSICLSAIIHLSLLVLTTFKSLHHKEFMHRKTVVAVVLFLFCDVLWFLFARWYPSSAACPLLRSPSSGISCDGLSNFPSISSRPEYSRVGARQASLPNSSKFFLGNIVWFLCHVSHDEIFRVIVGRISAFVLRWWQCDLLRFCDFAIKPRNLLAKIMAKMAKFKNILLESGLRFQHWTNNNVVSSGDPSSCLVCFSAVLAVHASSLVGYYWQQLFVYRRQFYHPKT